MKYSHNPNLVPYAKELRKNMTREERHLWYDFLKSHPVRFLRQKVIANYIVDFYCSKANLVIELDGSQHFNEEEMLYDRQRTAYLESKGLRVVRIANNELNQNFRGVCEYIDHIVSDRLNKPPL